MSQAPQPPEVIRDHTERVLALLHLIDGQVEDGSPVNERAHQNLLVARSIMARIIRREEGARNDRAA